MFKVELTYFKKSGKYYSEGEFVVYNDCSLIDIWNQVEALQELGSLPGLTEGTREFIILVNVPGHPHEHPKLFFPPGVV